MRFFIFLLIANICFAEIPYKLGLGSCLDQDYPTPAWASLEKESINSFFFLGDNIYGDVPSGKLDNIEKSYKKFNAQMPGWLRNTEKLFIWDDHDYGLNDAGGSYVYKSESQRLYNDAWSVDENDPRRAREGIYFSELKDIAGKKVLFIGLDTRYFRSNLIKVGNAYKQHKNTDTTILGLIQWKWLERELQQDHDILILGTSIQLLATEHRFEKWSNFPHERNKLLQLLDKQNSTVLVVSGDRHRSGFYKQNNIYEFTSSSLNKGIFPSYETDSLLLGKTYTQNNYGIVEFTNNSLNLFIKDENMNILESLEIPLK